MTFKMYRIYALVVLLLFSAGFSAQAQNSQKAKSLLDQVTAKVKSYDNIAIEFKYSVSNPKENLNQESKGTVGAKIRQCKGQ